MEAKRTSGCKNRGVRLYKHRASLGFAFVQRASKLSNVKLPSGPTFSKFTCTWATAESFTESQQADPNATSRRPLYRMAVTGLLKLCQWIVARNSREPRGNMYLSTLDKT